jgi:hypothetical protein
MYFIRTSSKTTVWTETEPEKPYWKKEIRIKPNTVETHLPETIFVVDTRTTPDKLEMCTAGYHYTSSFLKSNIQKTMRQGHLEACLSTTQQFLRQEPMEVLRRLPIIFVEDAQIHLESYDLLIWLMLAVSKGYVLSKTDERLILDSVATAMSAKSLYQHHPPNVHSTCEKGKSLLVRASFGGMPGDMKMLENLATHMDTLEFIPDWIRAPPCVPFSIDQMVKQSIDFHCCPNIPDWCSEKTHLDRDEIKKAIWHHWSSPNIRESVFYTETQGVFQRIQYLMENYAIGKIKSMNATKKKVMVQKKITHYTINFTNV